MPLSPPLLISASRRTDIPAFYGEWFRDRLNAGWCETANPFSGEVFRVSLAPRDVLGWVFWSRNYVPFLGVLADLHARGQRFLCHFTITGYPAAFDPRTLPAEEAIRTACRLAEEFGPDVVQWRYDPILLSSDTPPSWHRENFHQLAARLEGGVRRCIFSFPTMYKKTIRNLEAMAAQHSVRVWSRVAGDFAKEDLAALAGELAAIATGHGIEMHSCCGDQWANPEAGIAKARCVDWPLLRRLTPGAGGIEVPRKPSRKGCGCYQSVDIGAYNTCGHGCAYCYAVEDAERAQRRSQTHSPGSPRL
jgi:hypothetical protein